jgi:predicted DNA-binding antitoxin AbrB/MazE fold protein
MAITVQATYENGVLKPAQPVPLKEHAKVEIVIHEVFPGHDDSSGTPPIDARTAALQRLLSLQLPVADWEQMEDEIAQGAME